MTVCSDICWLPAVAGYSLREAWRPRRTSPQAGGPSPQYSCEAVGSLPETKVQKTSTSKNTRIRFFRGEGRKQADEFA